MNPRILFFSFIFAFSLFAHAGEMSTTQSARQFKLAKILFDAAKASTNMEPHFSCAPAGDSCSNSLDCCDSSSFCKGGYCDAPIGGCVSDGGHCSNSLDCCSTSFCNDGTCG